MPNMLKTGVAWLRQTMSVAAAELVTYSRGGFDTINVPAVIGETRFVSNLEGAARIERMDRDYIIAVANMPAGYAAPAVGDRFTQVINGVTVVHQCMKPDTGEPAFRWSDPHQTAWRIHTKRVA